MLTKAIWLEILKNYKKETRQKKIELMLQAPKTTTENPFQNKKIGFVNKKTPDVFGSFLYF